MASEQALEADQAALREAVSILRQRVSVLELRAKGHDEDARSWQRVWRVLDELKESLKGVCEP